MQRSRVSAGKVSAAADSRAAALQRALSYPAVVRRAVAAAARLAAVADRPLSEVLIVLQRIKTARVNNVIVTLKIFPQAFILG